LEAGRWKSDVGSQKLLSSNLKPNKNNTKACRAATFGFL